MSDIDLHDALAAAVEAAPWTCPTPVIERVVRVAVPHIEAAVREQMLREFERRIEAFIRHGEAVPADVTTYPREAVHNDLRNLLADLRGES